MKRFRKYLFSIIGLAIFMGISLFGYNVLSTSSEDEYKEIKNFDWKELSKEDYINNIRKHQNIPYIEANNKCSNDTNNYLSECVELKDIQIKYRNIKVYRKIEVLDSYIVLGIDVKYSFDKNREEVLGIINLTSPEIFIYGDNEDKIEVKRGTFGISIDGNKKSSTMGVLASLHGKDLSLEWYKDDRLYLIEVSIEDLQNIDRVIRMRILE